MDLKSFFKDKIILVTGGTGTIGSEIVFQLLKFDPKAIRVLSNSENELWETQLRFKSIDIEKKIRYLLGDITNYTRIKRAMVDVDYVFNAAAIKHVPISEYNPLEAINVNIYGLENVIEAAFANNVKKLVQISTDKAVNPTTTMGATKMLGERIAKAKNYSKGSSDLVISCVRFGNVLGSRGSVIPLIKDQIYHQDYVTLTSESMNRFFMSISQAISLVLKAMYLSKGGEIFVFKMPTVNIKDLFEVIIENYSKDVNKDPKDIKIKIIGPRAGEQLDECLISPIEYDDAYENDEMYILNLEDPKGLNVNPVNLKNLVPFSTVNSVPLNKNEIKKMLLDLNLL